MIIKFMNREVPKIGLVVDVYVGGKRIGAIYRVEGGWQYQISKRHVGDVLPSLQAVKNSLVGES